MAIVTRSPLRVVGACVNSGSVNTGEQNQTYGGAQSATIYSGMVSGVGLTGAPLALANTVAQGADVQFVSGPGRLKDILIAPPTIASSGMPVVFYDGALATSGGPFVSSGHRILGAIPAGGGIQGAFGLLGSGVPAVVAFQVIALDIPFYSGLCCNLKSGAPGFTVTWTPETNPVAPFIG